MRALGVAAATIFAALATTVATVACDFAASPAPEPRGTTQAPDPTSTPEVAEITANDQPLVETGTVTAPTVGAQATAAPILAPTPSEPKPTFPPRPTVRRTPASPTPTASVAPTEPPPPPTANEHIAGKGDGERVFEEILSAFQRGHDLSEQGRWLEAIEALQTAQQLEEKDSRVLQRLLGHAYWKDGQPRQAIEHFTRAINVGDSAEDRMNRARAYSEIERCDLAVEDMQQALGMGGESGRVPHTDAETHAVMAQCHSDPTMRIEHWQEYIRAAETHGYGAEQISQAYVELAWTHQDEGDPGEAERMLNEAVAIDDGAFTRTQRAMLHFSHDNCELATKDSLAALSKPPVIATGSHTSGEASRLLAACYTRSENFEAALQHAEMAHELMRDHRYSEEDVEQIAGLEQRLQQVVERW